MAWLLFLPSNTRKTELPSAALTRVFLARLGARTAPFALLCSSLLAGDGYHLTARLWSPLQTPPDRMLDILEGVCRFSIQHQNEQGAIIDPYLHREHQYATPYFAYAVGTLLEQGRAKYLLAHGARAMEHATACFHGGRDPVPDQHGEFFIATLTGALALYEYHVPREQWQSWRERMKKPSREVIRGGTNN